MTRTIELPVKPISTAAFSSFGDVVETKDEEPIFRGKGLSGWRFSFSAKGTTELMVLHYTKKLMSFSVLERHFNVSQCYFPLGNAAMVMVVGPPTDEDRKDGPAPESIRAFLVRNDQGVLIFRGVWHTLSRFPLAAEGASFAFLTTAETQAELELQAQTGAMPKLTQTVDYAEHGIDFLVTDPHGLLTSTR